MKRRITYLSILALAVQAFASCTVQLQDINPDIPKHVVHFSSANQETRTGLTVGEEMVFYDWNKTDLDHVHLFELDANDQSVHGKTLAITTDEDYLTAHFDGAFSSEGERTAPFRYAAVIATKPDEQLSFVVPPVQYPDAVTQKDPDAEFLIGYSRKAYDEPTGAGETVVDLYFDRMVAMSRLALSNFKGVDEKVLSVTINAENGLAGSASYSDIDFENASVRFVRDEAPGILTLSYGEGVSVTAGEPFYAYFVTIPGAVKFTSIEVLTDQYRYVRSIAGGKEYTFSEKTFKDIKLDLAKATAEACSEPVNYTKVSSLAVGGTYLIVDADDRRIFKGSKDGKYESVLPVKDVITDAVGSLSAYEFTVENSGEDYYLVFNDGKYLVCDYGNAGNGDSGIRYVDTRAQVTFPYALTTDNNGAFFFSTTQMTSTSNKNQVLYFKEGTSTGSGVNIFKIGGSGTGIGVHLYQKEGKLGRGLRFDPESVTCAVGDTPEKPVLSGTYTTVAYASSDDDIATVDEEGNVTTVAAGTVTITATAEEDDEYLEGSASYTLTVLEKSIYTKVSSIAVGGSYLIVSATDDKLFKGAANGSPADVAPVDDVITDIGASLAGYEFTVEYESGSFYLRFNNGKYLVCNYSGNGTTGLSYVNAKSNVTYPYAVSIGDGGAFFFNTTQATSPYTPDQILYYNAGNNAFKIGGSGSDYGVHLYLKEGSTDSPARKFQKLSFVDHTVSWVLGDNYAIDNVYLFPQEVGGAQTGVTYSSDREDVAKIEGGMIRIVGAGSATITATAEESEGYFSATASYVLRILYPPSEGWKDLETFNLENRALHDYLDAAISSYTDTDDATNTVMEAYANGSAYSDIDRKDCPNPVKITWANPASDATVVSIYEDDSLYKPIWSQNATERSTSADVYNLIPGRKYYYTVSEGATVWEKGYFNTTGRRRMIKVSDVEAKGHANNCRDLGGLEVWDEEDGVKVKKTIKYGYLFRGSNMDRTTEAEQTILTGFLNVGMDVDLRSGSSGSSGSTENGNQTCYRPLPSYVGYVNPGFNSFADLTNAGKVKNVIMAIFQAVLQPEAEPVYFHCWVGADRTGYFAMMIEGLLGVSEKDCSIDYELTSFSEAVGLRYRTGAPEDHYFRQGIAFLRDKEGDTFQEKIQNYLVNEVEIDAAAIKDFKDIVLEKSNQ